MMVNTQTWTLVGRIGCAVLACMTAVGTTGCGSFQNVTDQMSQHLRADFVLGQDAGLWEFMKPSARFGNHRYLIDVPDRSSSDTTLVGIIHKGEKVEVRSLYRYDGPYMGRGEEFYGALASVRFFDGEVRQIDTIVRTETARLLAQPR